MIKGITVKELIKKLQSFPGDLQVGFIDYNGDRFLPATELKEVSVSEGNVFGYSDHPYGTEKNKKIIGISWK